MKLVSVTLQGFRSFQQEQVFDFTSPHGVNAITGVNSVDKELEANGAGKSTILEAVCWCLYGKTSTGVRSPALHNWEGKEKLRVTVLVIVGGEQHAIYRSWSPNKLTLDGSPVEQDKVDQVLRLHLEAFQLVVYNSQLGNTFFDLTPTEKLRVFTAALSLEKWSTYSAKASSLSSSYREKYSILQNTVTASIARLSELEDQSFLSDMKDWDTQEALAVSRLTLDLADIKDHAASIVVGDLQTAVTKDASKADRKLADSASAVSDVKADIRHVARDAAALTKGPANCRTCGAKLKQKDVSQQKEELAEEQQVLQQELVVALKSKEKYAGKVAVIREANTVAREGVAAHNANVSARARELKELEASAYRTETRLNTRSSNPFTPKQKALEARREAVASSIQEAQEDVADMQVNLESTEYWVKGFKNIQLFLVDEALLQLEVEVNAAVEALGLKGWRISFAVERETLSKTITKGFSVLIHSPHNEKPVPWESWSGGEMQRLRLAGSFGVSSLLASRFGATVETELYDEPTAHLTEGGVLSLLTHLKERAIDQKKSIWVVSHMQTDFGGFTSTAEISKTPDGSRVLQ